jgi:hypothetical protein
MNFKSKLFLLFKTKPWIQNLEMEKDCEINQNTMSYFLWNLWKGKKYKPFAILFVQDCANDWTSCVKSYIVLGLGNFVVQLLMRVELFYL